MQVQWDKGFKYKGEYDSMKSDELTGVTGCQVGMSRQAMWYSETLF